MQMAWADQVGNAHVRLREWLMPWARRLGSQPDWRDGAVVLLYHRVDKRRRDPFSVDPRAFEDHLDLLAAERTVVTVRELAERVAAGHELDGYLAISFDDGYRCTFEEALPRLEARGLPATVFIDTARLGQSSDALLPEQLEELCARGFEVGSHGVQHTDLRELSDFELEQEMVASRERLSELCDQPIGGFAYPFGAFDMRVAKAAKLAGYDYACTCRQHDHLRPNDDVFRLKRVEVNRGDAVTALEAKMRGANAAVYRRYYTLVPGRRAWLQEG